MNNANFTVSFLVNQTPKEAFDAINNVSGWWTENTEGNSVIAIRSGGEASRSLFYEIIL